MKKEQRYKDLLLQEQKEALVSLDPYQSPEDNVNWLWSSFKKLEGTVPIDDELLCSLCQMALHYGRSSLEHGNVFYILNEPDKSNQQRIEALIEHLDDP
jgi:hypothetical protein